ncbi:MAG: type II toxin-antitoxin system VapC family toxin [Chloroflexi bacterium]|nr:type II toxin-antitoxin system VapC family toxin [Chloroflexota bacterium]
MSFVLDAFALLTWLQDEQGSDLVEGMLTSAKRGEQQCFLSVISLGEVYYRLLRLRGEDDADAFWEDTRSGQVPLSVVEVSRSRALHVARLKGRYPISYAEAFAAQLAVERDLPLVTGHQELKALVEDGLLVIRWLGR